MSNKLPINLLNLLKGEPEFDYETFVAKQDLTCKINSIRFNSLKQVNVEEYPIEEAIPWCNNGFYLKDKLAFMSDPLFHAGCYCLQSVESMFLDHVIRALGLDSNPLKVLDLFANVGQNTTLMNSSLHPESLFVSNEIIKTKVDVLEENVKKWGYPNTIVTNNEATAFSRLPGYFDVVMFDTPRSGAYIFHKDLETTDEDRLENIKLYYEQQQRDLAAAVSTIKTHGYLFYSSRFYSFKENGDILDWLIEEFGFESITISIDKKWPIQVTESSKYKVTGYCFNAPFTEIGQFFFAILKKKAVQKTFSISEIDAERNIAPQHIAKEWLNMDGLYSFLHEGALHIFPEQYEQDLTALLNVLYVRTIGTKIGKLVDNEFIPSHDLALSIMARRDIKSIELNLEDALIFLRKGNLSLEINKECYIGWVLVRYKTVNLGWIKVESNSIVNYYPDKLSVK